MVVKTIVDSIKGIAVVPPPRRDVKTYTWEEVAQHNTEQSAWVYCGKTVYDITPWLNSHPGGKEMLLLSAGRDITDLFQSYHPFTDKPQQILDKFAIGEVRTTEFPQYRPDSGFYKELREEVKGYFARTGLSYKDPVPGLVRLALIELVFFASFWVMFAPQFREWSVVAKTIAAVLFGICQALPLLHVMHDSSHTSFGRSEWWWANFGRLTMDWICGACFTSWHHQHVLGHHVYTNVLGADPDLPMTLQGDLRRVAGQQEWGLRYRLQHYYLMVLYGLLAIKFRIQDVTDTLLKHTNGAIRVNFARQEVGWQILTKSVWFAWRFIVPYTYWGTPLCGLVCYSLLAELVTGWYLTFNFQVSHVSPGIAFPDLYTDRSGNNPAGSFDDEWALNQVKTTVDYAHGDFLATFLCGALNYQTVHHLFPCVSQYHYPALAPLVMKVCEKHGVRYHHVPSFWQAFGLHFQHLKTLATAEGHNKHH